jgi:hypothetical protein
MAGTLIAVLTVLTFVAPRLRRSADVDMIFGLTVLGMLLVSPITWDHYLLLLPLPIAVTWARLPRGGIGREMLLLLLAILWLQPRFVVEHGLILLGTLKAQSLYQDLVVGPLETVTALSVQTYALVGLFVLALLSVRDGHLANTIPGGGSSIRGSLYG